MSGVGNSFTWAASAEQVGCMEPGLIGAERSMDFLQRSATAREMPWILGCSGGGDSVLLVLWCWAKFPERRAQMRVAHLNHAQRGVESDDDAALVADLARGLGSACSVGMLDEEMRGSSEARLREARLRFFFDLTPAGGIILLGHHLDDVLETQLMRLGRGASAAGLCAPRPFREAAGGRFLVRPLLNTDKETILNVLRSNGIPYREDSSNRDPSYFRNRMRNDVIPLWKKACLDSYVNGIAYTRQWLEEDDDALQGWASHLLITAQDEAGSLDLRVFQGLPCAVGRRVLLTWMNRILGESPFAHDGLELVMQLIYECAVDSQREERWSAGKHHFLEVVGRRARLVSLSGEPEPIAPEALILGVPHALSPDQHLLAEQVALTREDRARILGGNVRPDNECFLDYTALTDAGLKNGPWVRNWEKGDRYHPLGAPGRRKLQDCFVDRTIPPRERKCRPIVCLTAGGEILWCPGLLPSDRFKVTETTKAALRLTYRATSSA